MPEDRPDQHDTLHNVSEAGHLNRRSLGSLGAHVRVPRFDPAHLRTGIVHLGCGNFHRGHQAVATQAAIEIEGQAGLRWGIASAAMRRPDLPRILQRQDNLYTLLQRDRDATRGIVVGSISEALFAPEDKPGIAPRIASPDTAIVTLTITAAGYCLEPSSGLLDANHDDIAHDVVSGAFGQSAAGNLPKLKSAIGILAHGLARVRAAGHRPPTILSCDNLSANGASLRAAVSQFCSLAGDDALATWVEQKVQFPDTMVDRIVPPPSEHDAHDASVLLGGLRDDAALSAEPWFQWIITDFEGPRPMWHKAGALLVSDVTPFEIAKLRMLNGTHMLLAYVGALAGLQTIADAANDPVIGELATRFMRDEQGAEVAFHPDDRDRYALELMERFRNPAILHQMERIGRNGSVKIATRIIEPMRENIIAGRSTTGAILLIASWIRWFALHEQDELDVTLDDPRIDALADICRDERENFRGQAEAFLAMEEVFGPPLPNHDAIVHAIAQVLADLSNADALDVFRHYLTV